MEDLRQQERALMRGILICLLAFAAGMGLPTADQAAFRHFGPRLLLYRNMIRSDLVAPVESSFLLVRSLLEQAGAWEDCLAGFLSSRGVESIFYRDLCPAFLAWLVASGWGQDRWPWLLQLAHFELITVLVAHHPGGAPGPPLRPLPALEDRLVLEAPTQMVTYDYRVHETTPEDAGVAAGTTHLLAYRDAEGWTRWTELTPATAALLQRAQEAPIGRTLRALKLTDPSEVLELLADLQVKGAIRGFA